MTFKLKRNPYTPVATLEAFVRMGLSLMPPKELPNFQKALEWINQRDHSPRS
jgi:hypothetical protein